MPQIVNALTTDLVLKYTDPTFQLDSTTASTRVIKFTTNGLKRWQLFCNNTAEGGANAGSDFNIGRYDDSGNFLSTILTVNRASGSITFSNRLNAPAGTTAQASIRAPHGVAPTSPVDGDIWTTTAGIYVRINGVTIGPLVDVGTSQAYVDNHPWQFAADTVGKGSTDLNTITATGLYETSPTSPNSPVVKYGFLIVLSDGSANYVTQLWQSEDTTTEMWFRRCNSGTWGSWVKVLDSGTADLRYLPLTGGTITGTLGINGTNVVIQPAGATAATYYNSGSVNRWAVGKTSDNETGSNTGSNFGIARCNDAGAVIDIPFFLSRDTGNLALTAALTVEYNIETNSNLVVQQGGQVYIDGDVGLGHQTVLTTNGSRRWVYGADSTSESGGNAGSHFSVDRFNDSGAYVDSPLVINRTSGAVSVNGAPAARVVVGGTKPTSPPVGTIWVPSG